jgi:DNA-binding response OmpR family regulator
MVYGFVRQSSGAVNVFSEPGCGTTFELYFPAVGEPTLDADQDRADDVVGGRETILVVEDEPAVRRLIARVLRDHGYDVIETDDTDEALAVGCDLDRSIDMLVADVVMPVRSGPELAAEIIAARPGMGVLYVSGYLRGVAVRRGLVEANANILSKPFGPKELATAVRECLDRVNARSAQTTNAAPM